jgi:hypothetical protein
MSFKKSSSKVERYFPLGGVTRQTRKGFGITFQSVIRARKRIQNPPRQWRQNVIAQVVGWENLDPNHKIETTKGKSTHCHLR